MKITLVYADCRAKKGGDFSAAAEIAFVLQTYYRSSDAHAHSTCMLASSSGGVAKFKAMYGSDVSQTLHVHGLPIGVTTLADFAASEHKPFLVNYVEVAQCAPADRRDVAPILNDKVKMLFIGLPHYPDSSVENYRMQQYFYPYYERGQISFIYTGFGADRAGIPIRLGPDAVVDHAAYRAVTNQSQRYGFIYFNDSIGGADKFVKDYLRVCRRAYKTRYFVIVGGRTVAIEALKSYARRRPVTVFDMGANNAHEYRFDHVTSTLSCAIDSMSSDPQRFSNDDTTYVALLARVPNTQMRSLMQSAVPYVGTTGVSSTAESLAFGKMTFYQFIGENKQFIECYQQSMPDTQAGGAAGAEAQSGSPSVSAFVRLSIWHGSLQSAQVRELGSHLKDDSVCDTVTRRNAELMSDCRVLPELQSRLDMAP